MNDHVDVARTSAAKIQSAIKRTQLVSEQSTVNNACPVGYFSPNCSLPCRYPNYGAGCQLKCVCEIKNCSHITGCQNSSLGVLSCCSTMRTKRNTSAKQEAMKITIWTMVSLSLVFVTIYFKLNTKKTLETANVI
uniref:Uncharacterized protein LOC111105473 n=1 Tax=Crassostrea virginica TaxID=6565 RepID=A0A8B8AWK7_CRAVI|nr:uncharacterized protein LOC111105473 [Crassostrea virginica]